MTNCPFCKALYKPNASYCHGCGRKVVESRICTNRACRNYNKVLADDESFCSGCGEQSYYVYIGVNNKSWLLYFIIAMIIAAVALLGQNGENTVRPSATPNNAIYVTVAPTKAGS